MKDGRAFRGAAGTIPGALCALICCLLISDRLLQTPFFGGVFFCFGKALWDGRAFRTALRRKSAELPAPCLAFERMHMLVTAASGVCLAALIAWLAVNPEGRLKTLAVALLCAVSAALLAFFFLRLSERVRRRDSNSMLLLGFALCAAAVLLCALLMRKSWMIPFGVWAGLAVCSAGALLCLTALERLEARMPEVLRASGDISKAEAEQYPWIGRSAGGLLGAGTVLLVMTVLSFMDRTELLRGQEGISRLWLPLILFLPSFLFLIAAGVSVYRFPLDERAFGRIRRFLALREKGEENPALQKQVEVILSGQYRQSFLLRFLIVMLRAGYARHRVYNADHIPGEGPVVFICNHGEIYGPIICALYFPVPFRPWSISMMLFDGKKVADYLYENTFSRVKGLPRCLQKLVSGVLGHLSVIVFDELEAVPVYRDSPAKLRETVRESVECLEAGDHLLIFPEKTDRKYARTGIGELDPGFVMLAMAYHRKTGKALRFLPLYADQARRRITFGEVIHYQPEAAFAAEQERITREATEQIRTLAEGKQLEKPAEGKERSV